MGKSGVNRNLDKKEGWLFKQNEAGVKIMYVLFEANHIEKFAVNSSRGRSRDKTDSHKTQEKHQNR